MQCRLCGLTMGAQRLPHHEERCPRNPDMFARLRQFMHDYAEDGAGLPATLYSDLILGEHLPSVSQLNRVFGTWRAGWSTGRTLRGMGRGRRRCPAA